MRYLYQKSQCRERFDILISLTNIRSDPLHDALRMFLVDGMSESTAMLVTDITKSNFSRGLATLNSVAQRIERVKEIDARGRKNAK